ncbi:MAG: alpha/beta hydrolase [Bacteroidetes bacterium]|nr:alpha/beta hydrolase [Bacteroidota bacterium]
MKTSYYLVAFALFVSCTQPYGTLSTMEFTDLSYPFEVKHAQIRPDINLAYMDEGSGKETIIFIHGLGSYAPAWKKNIDSLKLDYRCIAIDLPGYGKSSKAVHSGKMEFYADVVIDLMNTLKLEKATLAGHSMGGQISILASLKYPDRIKNLILVDPAGFESFSEGEKQWFREVMTQDLVKLTPVGAIRSNLADNFYNLPEDAEFMITDRIAIRGAKEFDRYCLTVVRSVHGMVDQPVIDYLDRITQPTLILFGENDNLIPNRFLHAGFTRDIAEIGKSKIQNSTMVMIPECGHFAQFEKPEIVNSEIKKFLSR